VCTSVAPRAGGPNTAVARAFATVVSIVRRCRRRWQFATANGNVGGSNQAFRPGQLVAACRALLWSSPGFSRRRCPGSLPNSRLLRLRGGTRPRLGLAMAQSHGMHAERVAPRRDDHHRQARLSAPMTDSGRTWPSIPLERRGPDGAVWRQIPVIRQHKRRRTEAAWSVKDRER